MLNHIRKRRERRIMWGFGALGLILIMLHPAVQFARAQGFNIPAGAAFLGHMLTGASAPPTVTNATLYSGSTDLAGKITSTTTTNPVLTFGTAYTSIPFCVMYNQGEAENITLTVTATTITFGGVVNGAIASYVCFVGLGG